MFSGFPPNYKKSTSIIEGNNGPVEVEEMVDMMCRGNVLLFGRRYIMQIPVLDIYQPGIGLVVGITVGAFHYIFTHFGKRYDRLGATIFAY
jgi:hypothetical protein